MNRIRQILLLLTFLPSFSFGQSKVDSLLSELPLSGNREKIKLYSELIYQLRDTLPIQALNYFDDALVLADEFADSIQYSLVYGRAAQPLISLGDFDKAREFLFKSLSYRDKADSNSKIYQYELLSYIEYLEGNYSETLKYVNILLKQSDSFDSAFSFNNIGDLYYQKGQYDSSYIYHKKSEKMFLEIGAEYQVAIARQYIAKVSNSLSRYAEALEIAENCKKVFEDKLIEGNRTAEIEVIRTNKILADAHIGLGNFKAAQIFLDKCYKHFLDTNNSIELGETLFSLSSLNKRIGNIKNANKYYEEASDTINAFKLRAKDKILALHKKRFEIENQNTKDQATQIALSKARNDQFVLVLIFGSVVILILFIGFIQKRKLSKKLVLQNAELEFLNKKFSQFLENAGEAFRLIDSDGKIILWNEANVKISGIDKEDAIGEFIWDIILRLIPKYNYVYNIRGQIKEKRMALFDNESPNILNFINEIKDVNGVEKHIITTSFPIKVGNNKFIGEISRDITQNKKFEKELITSKERAEASDKIKSEFMAQMSHEIRTPLNSILSFNEFLEIELSDSIHPDLSEIFLSINRAGNRIIRTVDLLLNMSEIQAGSYDYQPRCLDLVDEVIEKNLENHKKLANNKGLEFHFVNKCGIRQINIDEYSISQIIQNLVDNAIKYTEKGFIKLVLDTNPDNILYLEVSDSGIGISEDFVDYLFNPFTQEEQGYTRRYDGSGLGLALVKSYCDINNLDISVRSKKNEGSTFTVKFNNSYPIEENQ